jgi:hypothetical protein
MEIVEFNWSGANSILARETGSRDLAAVLESGLAKRVYTSDSPTLIDLASKFSKRVMSRVSTMKQTPGSMIPKLGEEIKPCLYPKMFVPCSRLAPLPILTLQGCWKCSQKPMRF